MVKRRASAREGKVYRFDPTCTGKRFFITEAEALEAADVGMLDTMTVNLGVYQCPTCHYWHLTSLTPKDIANSN